MNYTECFLPGDISSCIFCPVCSPLLVEACSCACEISSVIFFHWFFISKVSFRNAWFSFLSFSVPVIVEIFNKDPIAIYNLTRLNSALSAPVMHSLVETDHSPLAEIFKENIVDAPAQLQRLLLRCLEFEIEVRYRRQENIPVTDALSLVCLKKRRTYLCESE